MTARNSARNFREELPGITNAGGEQEKSKINWILLLRVRVLKTTRNGGGGEDEVHHLNFLCREITLHTSLCWGGKRRGELWEGRVQLE